MERRIVIIGFLLFQLMPLFAQKGTIKGVVLDKETGEEVVGAAVVIEGTSIGTATGFNGDFILDVEAGTYNLRCQFISYEPVIKQNVVVKPGAETVLKFEMVGAELKLEEVKVVARANRESDVVLLIERKNSLLATQSIGAQELSRKGVGDAESAVTKVSGISKQEGVKNVFVRGLGDRYNATFLNGFPLPSEDPEYKNISLDLFSTDMIQTVMVNKVFGAKSVGDVGGADINILTRELSGNKEFGVELSAGINSQTTGEDFKNVDGVSKLGFAKKTSGPTNLSQYTFNNQLDPNMQASPFNRSVKAFGGNQVKIKTNSLNYYLIGSYGTDFNKTDGIVRNTGTTGIIWQDQTYQKFSQSSSHMVMGNMVYFGEKFQLNYNAIYIHSNTQTFGEYFGLEGESFQSSPTASGLLRRQQVNDNSLIVNQIYSKIELSERTSLDAGLGYNLVQGSEPDRRINYLSLIDDNTLRPTGSTGRQQRYFSDLTENDVTLKAGLTFQLGSNLPSNRILSVGYMGRLVNRDFEAIEYDHSFTNPQLFILNNVRLSDYFNQNNIGSSAADYSSGKFLLDRNADEYSVFKMTNGLYSEMVYNLGSKLIAIAGVRVDKINMDVDYNVNRGGDKGKRTIDELFILPGLNFKYTLTDKHVVRLGMAKTYTLPQAKEISPFRYVDVSFKSQGNPYLKPSNNYSIDLRWDYYVSNDELLSLTGFYKLIQDPISRVEKQSAGNFLTYDNIADKANIGGIEMEFRKNIFKRVNAEASGENKLSFGLNASYTYTNVKLNRSEDFTNSSSQLEGAAPLIVNADLSHHIAKNSFSINNSIVLNYFSDRVYTVGMAGFQDIIEDGIPTLDFISGIKSGSFGIGIKAKNLLNPNFRLTREPNAEGVKPIVLSDYKKDRVFSLSLSYNF